MAIKCILFDADGVLLKAEKFSLQYQKKFSVSNDEMIPFFKGEFQDCLVGKADLKDLIEPWLSKWKWNNSADDFLRFWFEAENQPDERMIQAVRDLRKKGIECHLATNQEKYRTQYMKEQMDFGKLFDQIFSSSKVGFKKPEREFFEFILNKLKRERGVNPQEVMFFDDSAGHVASAKELGIDARLYENFEEFEKIIAGI